MKKVLLYTVSFLMTAQCAFCEVESTNQELSQSLKSHSHEPGFLSIIFALLFVICLIYFTGVIYSRLNIVGAQKVKQQLKNIDISSVVVLSTTQLGQAKNLHVIEVDNKRLLIGSTANSINLIKELEKPEEIDEPKVRKKPKDPIEMLYGSGQENIFDEVRKSEIIPEKEFDVHRKYL